ncbi:MAG: hypothetical protein LBR25_05810 [Erysipelotrichaceae bacterium]|jgi:hypothetical protein|nr:hypothetical protein [Erysipelotrichaceae bacterium]
MASIAYVTDSNMMEFHRLHGHTTVNFWRLTAKKKIADLQYGDFVFFLTKIGARNKEKGIIGYGVMEKDERLSLNGMWTKYGELNGFATKAALKQEMLSVNKAETLPTYFNCLLLQEVTFFSHPIYLSELGIKVSNLLESYTYLDKLQEGTTMKLLALGTEIGADLWSSTADNAQKPDIFRQQAYHIVSKAASQLPVIYTRRKATTAAALLEAASQKDINSFAFCREIKYLGCSIEKDKVRIFIPVLNHPKLKTEEIINILGIGALWLLLVNKEMRALTTKEVAVCYVLPEGEQELYDLLQTDFEVLTA